MVEDMSDEVVDTTSGIEAAPDELLICLQFLARHFDRPSSETVLVASLPMAGAPLTPELFLRASERIGLSSRVVRRPVAEFVPLYLPCIVFVQGMRPIILMSVDNLGRTRVFLPELGGTSEMSLAELKQQYAGAAIVVKPEYRASDVGNSSGLTAGQHWFWGTVKRYWRNYLYVVLAASCVNLLALATPLFIMNVYDRVLPNKALSTLWVLAIGLFLALIFDLLLKSARATVIDKVGRQIDVRLSTALFDKILNTKLSHRPMTTGSFANRIGEYEMIREFFTSNTVALLTDLCFVVLFLLVIYQLTSWVVIVPVAGLVIVVVAGLIIQHMMGKSIAAARDESAMRHSLLVESLGAIETVKSVRAEGYLLKKWENFVKHGSHTQERIKQLSSTGVNLAGFVQQMISVWIVIGGAYLFDEGHVTTGAIIATVMLANRAVAPLGQIAMTLTRARHAMMAIDALNQIMGQPDEFVSAASFVNRPVERGNIEFRKVSFVYPGSQRKVIEDLSFSIKAGEKVGIIGRIGSGKTTLGRLITALYEPTEGEILIDGVDIHQYHPHEIRKALALVVQEAELFHGSVKENIAMAAPVATDEEILRAARLAGVEEFISAHPMGFDMPVGERGTLLSGGQRQAVALARAVVNKARVLFLDEPSSAMDMASERAMIQRLQAAMTPEQTLIISTHRHSMLSLIDRLIVIDQGKIVADGPRDDVLAALAARAEQNKSNVIKVTRG